MRTRRSILALPVVLVALAGSLTLSPTAAAVAPHDATYATIVADLNNDGIPDHATLGQIGSPSSTQCSVTVRLGNPDGTFGAPVVYPYTLGQHLCPNEGIAVKLGNHVVPDLVVAASFDSYGTVVLTNYQVAGVYNGVTQPQLLRTGADFNGDGRQDIIEASFQTDSLITLINMPDAGLTRGPISACAYRPQYVIADFDQDGDQDMLLSANCMIPPNTGISATVLFGNGNPPVTLMSSRDNTTAYTVFTIDLNNDGIPDVGVTATPYNGKPTTSYFRNDGHGHFTPTPGP